MELVLTGEEDETGTRVMDPGFKAGVGGFEGTLRKSCVDSYIMRVPR